jgi:cell division protein FtsB
LSPRRVAAGLTAAVVGWVGFAVYTATANGHSLDGRVQTLQQQNANLQREIDQRKLEVAAAQTNAWLEEEARRLGYVLPGESVFVITTPGAAVPPDGGIDIQGLPRFYPSSPPSATPTPQPPAASPTPAAAPTPFQFSVSTPTPRPH